MSTKAEKLARISASDSPSPPIPEWPKLPAFLKERFPDKAEEIDAYNEKALEFFKKTNVIRS